MKNVLGGLRPPGGGTGDVCADECSSDDNCSTNDYCKSIGTDSTKCPDKTTKYICYPKGL
ncbi:hypothetical protein ACFQZI_16875 [Mucilaginibacter lutimaris]|uniref:Uncharacterized protein n=2 Tax=Mucilaginibacter lutimaris TaxID=931629 RepID=A0ABW2ZK77_9SPHI